MAEVRVEIEVDFLGPPEHVTDEDFVLWQFVVIRRGFAGRVKTKDHDQDK
jgi:hypothetical protein